MSELIAAVLRASQHRFVGRLAADPELKTLASGNSVCNVRMLVNRPGAKRDDGQEPDGFKLELWNELAISFVDAHQRGSLCDVTGRIKSESYTDRQGQPRTALVVAVSSWQPVGQPVPVAAAPQAQPVPQAKPATWESSSTDDDFGVPF